jgi:DNA-binding SARP family transcriptional activator
VRNDRLIAALWPDVDRAHGTASLRTAASQIRVATGSACVVREGAGLALRDFSSDVAELGALLPRLQALRDQGLPEAALAAAAPHARLLHGDLYADVLDSSSPGDDTWAEEAQLKVAELQRDVLTLQAECAAAVGRWTDALGLSRRAIARDPFCERPYRVTMRALAEMGEADQALRAFDLLQSTMEADLGVRPSAQSFAVRDRIVRDLATTRDEPGPEPRGVLRIPAQPGWGGSFEQYVLRWLLDRANGATVRVQATLLDDPRHVFALDVTTGIDGLVELVQGPGRPAASSA